MSCAGIANGDIDGEFAGTTTVNYHADMLIGSLDRKLFRTHRDSLVIQVIMYYLDTLWVHRRERGSPFLLYMFTFPDTIGI